MIGILGSRPALMFLLQPVLSFALATALVVLAMRLLRPAQPAVRAALWLVPLAKILLDLAQATPVAWIGSHGVDPARLTPGSRVGTVSLGVGGSIVPTPLRTVPRGGLDVRMGCR